MGHTPYILKFKHNGCGWEGVAFSEIGETLQGVAVAFVSDDVFLHVFAETSHATLLTLDVIIHFSFF